MSQTHYSILEVRRSASPREIEEAYRLLVRKCHPDLNLEDAAACDRFQLVQAAFDVLHNAENRRLYDHSLDEMEFRSVGGSFEIFADSAAGKNGKPIVAAADANDMDIVRFRERIPSTQMIIWRPRSRLLSIQDWLLSSDFVLPLALLLIYLGIHVVGRIFSAGE